METIEAIYRIVTPMFIGGADQDPSDGIRPPSFKGALRFWWRVLNWGRCYHQHSPNDEAAALRALHAEEARLFGAASKVVNGKEQGGQGVFLIRITQPERMAQESQWPEATPLDQSGYLGMGLWQSGSREKGNFQPHRMAIKKGRTFIVHLCFTESSVNKTDIDGIKTALKAVGLFGGLGSRNRRGFGSIALEQMDGCKLSVDSIPKYKTAIQSLLNPMPRCDVMPSYTALSMDTRIGILSEDPYKTAELAHQAAAVLYYKIRGMEAEVRGEAKRCFGQPLPLKPNLPKYDLRRASPLFFHIHPVGDMFTCNHIFMPAQFLPDEGGDMNFYRGVNTYMNQLQKVEI